MIREILALGLSNDKERIGVKTALCLGLVLAWAYFVKRVTIK